MTLSRPTETDFYHSGSEQFARRNAGQIWEGGAWLLLGASRSRWIVPRLVGVQGGGRKLPPAQGGWVPGHRSPLPASGTLSSPASKVKPGFLPTPSNQECLRMASAWVNQLQCKGSSLMSAMTPICQSAIKDFQLYKKKKESTLFF